MAMNFFEHQDKARRNTSWLVAVYILAVMGLVLFVWGAVVLGISLGSNGEVQVGDLVTSFFLVAIAVCGVIGLGSLFKRLALRAGGPAIAESLGGRALNMGTKDALERRVVNVVEEMAIAAGCPVPAIYLLDDEAGINAFAAGYSMDDAAIGITRGCAEQLTRDELQGVVAHEFSHIFNGDMKLNLRLIGTLAGITLLSTIGYILFRISAHTVRGNSKKEGAGIAAGLFITGAVLYLGGCLGALAAALIQAAISRQREFLADSSAVQFTRNPDGIGGALKKIGGFSTGSTISNPHVTETRHMFFSLAMNAAFATHPPIEERISRIDAAWSYDEKLKAGGAPAVAMAGAAGFAGAVAAASIEVKRPSEVIDQVGLPTAAHVAYARALKDQIPTEMYEHAHDGYSARAIVYALLLDREDEQVREAQCKLVDGNSTGDIAKLTRESGDEVRNLPRPLFLPLLEICKASLRGLPVKYYDQFKANIQGLIAADKKISLFEWCLQRSLLHHLEAHLSGRFDKGKNQLKIKRVASSARLLLSSIAYAGHDTPDEAQTSFATAMKQTGHDWSLLPGNKCSLKSLDAAISELVHLLPKHKEQLLIACVACVTADGRVSVKEAELLRVITELLECPLPPLLPTQG